MIGFNGVVQVQPAAGSANIGYATGSMSVITFATTSGQSYTASNIGTARLFAGALSGVSGNLTVTNAIGLHTYSGWATGATNKYALYNEDTGTEIYTVGAVTTSSNLVVGNYSTLGNIVTYKEKINALGNQSGTITVNLNQGPVTTLTATGNITINTNNLTNISTGQSVTLIITQDGTGNRILTSNLKYAGGSSTLSTAAGAIDVINVFYDGTNYLASLVKGYV